MSRWRFAVDRGGTFTDVIGVDPEGRFHVLKLLSSSPEYDDASVEGIKRILNISSDKSLPEEGIESIRFGTTVATNALLERKGGRVALLITKGFSDLLEIGYQSRPDIFSLCIKKPEQLYFRVIEADERIDRDGNVLNSLDPEALKKVLEHLIELKVDSVAIVLMHSWKNPEHELLCEAILKEAGITNIFASHKTINLIKVVTRGQSTVVNAYLSPIIKLYMDSIRKETDRIPIMFINSSGGLINPEKVKGKDILLSGPAGGVIGLSSLSNPTEIKGLIGFDMGGTSTDVSRYEGDIERIYERTIGGIELQTEMIHIITVASGGGSILWFDGQKMRVGPESSGAYPGPACYGFGGPLSVTDANLLTGRLIPDYMPKSFGDDRRSALDREKTRDRFMEITKEINRATNKEISPEETALGFLRIVNEKMALAIREISVLRGFDVRDYAILCFGGAGGQHACDLASILDIDQVIFHPLDGVFSAYGIGLSRQAVRKSRSELTSYNKNVHLRFSAIFQEMIDDTKDEFIDSDFLSVKRYIDLRPEGTDAYLTIEYKEYDETVRLFRKKYKRLFGFYPDNTALEAVNLRIEVEDSRDYFPYFNQKPGSTNKEIRTDSFQSIYLKDGFQKAPVYLRSMLPEKAMITGPTLIVDRFSTIFIGPDFKAVADKSGIIRANRIRQKDTKYPASNKKIKEADPVLLEVFNNTFISIATEMGSTLRHTARSVNIKERQDFSCAIFDSSGDLVANAPHIPVHIGSMADTVKAIIDDHQGDMREGDIFLTNNPYKGGSHLPDMTVVCPVYSKEKDPIFFTAARGHHADIGGITPGSMPSEAGHIDDEGILVDGIHIVRDGIFRENFIKDILTGHKFPARNIKEQILDIRAQIAACHKGANELREIIKRYGWKTVNAYMGFIQKNAEYSVKKALSSFLKEKNIFTGEFEDFLDDGTVLKAKITVIGGDNPPETVRAIIDFSGTGKQHLRDNLNAPLSVTRSAVLYVIKTLASTDIPLNNGCLKPIEIIVPEDTILSPSYPAPVSSGNVETSQRIVDVLLGSLNIAAASQGTMNNLLFEVEGEAPYYETIAGGSGAIYGCHGASGVQIHMTNTRMTDPEILEHLHPGVRVRRFILRKGSGGKGIFNGGDGIIREIEFLKPATVSIISERRVFLPYGVNGGGAGSKGVNLLRKKSGKIAKLPNRKSLNVQGGVSIIIKTPGGGAFGKISWTEDRKKQTLLNKVKLFGDIKLRNSAG